jgi:G6PDH family F420-dependent oxidoreductase
MAPEKLKIGYMLSSEEHPPATLVDLAVKAEAAGFDFGLISDHFHPWLDVQGHSSFVWGVLGAIAARTSRLEVGTGVTCPIMRTHPAIIAQAAATAASLMPGRFFLGVGIGEALNEHVVAQPWPPADVRQRMLVEAIEVIRELWRGKLADYEGEFFEVQNARIYSLPEPLPPIYMAAGGPRSTRLAGELADGLISTSADAKLIEAYREAGGSGPRYGQVAVCWAESEDEAVETAHRYWPIAALPGAFKNELPLPSHFEEAIATVRPEDVAKLIICGPSVDRNLAAIDEFVRAGFDHVYIHQIGPDQDGFFRFYEEQVLPRLAPAATSRA